MHIFTTILDSPSFLEFKGQRRAFARHVTKTMTAVTFALFVPPQDL